MSNTVKKPARVRSVKGRYVTSVPGFVLITDGSKRPEKSAPSTESASTVVRKVARALSKPGISREAVFKGNARNAYSYSVDPTDTSRVVRVAADGRRTVGRLVGDRFVPVKAA